ncbi:MAG: cyclase family protein [Steroidobacteraceae bacterium]
MLIPILSLEVAGRMYRADANAAYDISIPLHFDAIQLQTYGASAAQAEVYTNGSFIGDVTQGGSCNCLRYHLTPHCNGTHTESVGHLTRDMVAVNSLVHTSLLLARLITIDPIASSDNKHATDRVISLACLQSQLSHTLPSAGSAVIVRTLPNTSGKLTRNYDVGSSPAYFEPEALAWLAEQGIDHLLVDVPSVDRMDDGGHLLAHRAFWGLPTGDTVAAHATRPHATITELIYVPEQIVDGAYLLSLQVAPFVADAAPSRPLLYRLLTP